MENIFDTSVGIFYILHTMLGPCVYFMPAALNMSGYVFGSTLLFIVSIFTAGTIYYSLGCEKKIKKDELPLITLKIAQNKKQPNNFVVEFITAACSFVLAFALQKYFIDLVSLVVLDYWPNLSNTMVNYAVILLSFICFFAVGLVQHLDFIRFFTIANAYFIYSLMVLLICLNLNLNKFVAEVPRNLNLNTDYIFSLTLFVVSLFVQTKIPTIHPLMFKQDKNNTLVISILSALGGFILHGIIGYLGYRLLGNGIGMSDLMRVFLNSNSSLNKYIRNSYSIQNCYYQFLRCFTEYQGLCGIITILFAFPLTIAPITRFCKKWFSLESPESVMTQVLIITPLITGLTLLNAIPNVPVITVFGYIGPTFINLVSFLLPSFFYILNAERKSIFKQSLATIIMILSIGYFVFGCLNSLAYLIYPSKELQDFHFLNNHQRHNISEIN